MKVTREETKEQFKPFKVVLNVETEEDLNVLKSIGEYTIHISETVHRSSKYNVPNLRQRTLRLLESINEQL